jgi:membrane protein DedA with SNARE-associated domain/predicted transcriptional regulator
MNFLQGLHGVVAVVLLCGLLFAEESGVPLPFAPGEIVLLAAGLLIAAGGLDPYVFIPLAMFACVAGSVVGYSWARLVGERGLTALAQRLHQQRNLERVSKRVRSAGWLGVALSRLIPGLRIYTTLVAGAVRVPWRTFIVAMVPSTIVWVGAFVALGTVVGIPVEHFFTSVEALAVQGVILVVMGLGIFFAIRRTPPTTGAGLVRVPRVVRALIAAAIDIGVIASIVTGLLALGRRLFNIGIGAGWLDAVVPMVVVGIIYIVAARRSAGATVGEALLQTSYVSGRQLPHRPMEAWQAARALLSGSADELQPTADLLRALADSDRLRLVRHLLDQPRTADELAALTKTESFEVRHQLDRLLHAGVLVVQADGDEARSRIRSDLVGPLLEFLSATRRPAAPASAEEAALIAGDPTSGATVDGLRA